MRLADFINSNIEEILVQWEAFAAVQLPAAATMHPVALRDHAQQMLQAISLDLQTAQSRHQQKQKSKGLAPEVAGAPDTAAQTHALLRAQSGFDIHQLAAEYRALRASVLRLWIDRCHPGAPDLDDMVRFNEAIDQALAESITFFSAQVEQSRNLLLGMLAHDMRTPLQTIDISARLLAGCTADPQVPAVAERVQRSAVRIGALLGNLLDFGRSQLGLRLPVTPHAVDLSKLLMAEMDQLRTVYPGRTLSLHCTGACEGQFDGMRVQQMVENLVVNAFKHGDDGGPVDVIVRGEAENVVIEVHNAGQPIDPQELETFFDPLRRGADNDGGLPKVDGMGLGLFIAREVARAHAGDVTAASRSGQTIFTCTLPRLR